MIVELLPTLGTILSVGMTLSMRDEIGAVINDKSTGHRSFLPYVGFIMSNVCSSRYAIELGANELLYGPIVNLLISAYFSFIFFQYIPHHARRQSLLQLSTIILISFVSESIVWFLGEKSTTTVFLGMVATFASIFMLGAPITNLISVYKRQDASTLSFPMAAVSNVNCFVWLIYGIVLDNIFVYGPSIIGFVISSVQLFMIFKFTSPPNDLSSPIGDMEKVQNKGR